MKRLTREEFQDRLEAVIRSQRIFIDSGLTDNVNTAFMLYQEILADREREILLSTKQVPKLPPSEIGTIARPICPDCGSEFYFRGVPPNDEGIKVQLVCSNTKCDTVLNDENDINWWREFLGRESI